MKLNSEQITYLKKISGKELWALKEKKNWNFKKFAEVCEVWIALRQGQEELVRGVFDV